MICPLLCPFEKPIPVVEFKVDFYPTVRGITFKKKLDRGLQRLRAAFGTRPERHFLSPNNLIVFYPHFIVHLLRYIYIVCSCTLAPVISHSPPPPFPLFLLSLHYKPLI